MPDWRALRIGEKSTRRIEEHISKEEKLTRRNFPSVAGNQNFLDGSTLNS